MEAVVEGESDVVGQPQRHQRRGRRTQEVGTTAVAHELRQRRDALDLTVRQAAERAHVTAAMISEIERGRRIPSVKTWAKLRQALGIDAPLSVLTRAQAPAEVLEVHLVRLAACLLSSGRVSLPDLGQALEVPAAAVREQLPLLASRLAACGFGLLTDGLEVRLEPLTCCEPPLQALRTVTTERRRRALSEEAVTVLTYVGWHGAVTRREIERFRGEESETLLGRLMDADLIAAVRDESQLGRPNRYRLTVSGLRTLGAASPEELREKLQPHLGALLGANGRGHEVSLEDQVVVLAAVTGFEEADFPLLARALRRPAADCAALLQRMVDADLVTVTGAGNGARYRIGAAGLEVLGRDGALAVRRVAEDAAGTGR